MKENMELTANTNKENRKWKKTSIGASEELYIDLCNQVNEKGSEPNNDSEKFESWEKPVTFDKYPIPTFPINVFNDPIKAMIEETAESLQTPVDLPAFIALGVLATSLSKKFIGSPKNNWREPLNLFIVTLLDSSSRKSPAFNVMVEPVINYQLELNEKTKLDVDNRKTERIALEKRIENLQREFGKDEDQQHLLEIKKINKRLLELPELFLPSIIADDSSPEALVSNMYKNNSKIAILTSEGDLFEKFKSKFTDVKYDVFLKSYSEDFLRTDRITRETEMIEKPNLTICVAAQPSVIKELPKAVYDRGLLARFIYSIPHDNLGDRISRTKEISKETSNSYITFIQKFLKWETKEPIPLKLSDEALNLLFHTMDEVEAEFREEGIFHDELRSWGGKLIGQLLRIAGILHISYQAAKVNNISDIDTTISKESFENAIKLKDYLIAHAQKAFGVMKKSMDFDDAEYVLKVILRQNNPVVDKNTIHQNTKKKIKGKERLQRAYDLLEYHSYIRQEVGGKSGRKGLVLVNPYLFEDIDVKKKDHNYPNLYKTTENTITTEGDMKNLKFPNSPNEAINNEKK